MFIDMFLIHSSDSCLCVDGKIRRVIGIRRLDSFYWRKSVVEHATKLCEVNNAKFIAVATKEELKDKYFKALDFLGFDRIKCGKYVDKFL